MGRLESENLDKLADALASVGSDILRSRLFDTSGTAVDPREEFSDHAGDTDATLHDGTNTTNVTESMTVPGKPDEIRIFVQNANGAYSVDITFDNTSLSLVSGATADNEVTQTLPTNTTVDVTFSDDSAASNTIDYDILLV